MIRDLRCSISLLVSLIDEEAQTLISSLVFRLPDKTPRIRKNKSPLAKDPTTKEGTVEVPGLGSLLKTIVDERHQSNHFGDLPLKKHLELSPFRGEP